MTNKEALSNEKAIKILQTAHLGKSWLVKEACEMAIKALEDIDSGRLIPNPFITGNALPAISLEKHNEDKE